MKNFKAYLKLHIRLVSGNLALIGAGGIVFLFLIYSIIGLILYPFILMGIILLTLPAIKKIHSDNLFGPGAALNMSLPVDGRTMVAVKLLTSNLVYTVMLAAIILPFLISGFTLWQPIIEAVRDTVVTHGKGTFLLAIIAADVIMLIFIGGAIDLLDTIRNHCRPLNMQTKTRKYLSQLPWRIPILAVLIWAIVEDDTATPILEWLSGKNTLPILIVAGIAEILIYVFAARRCVRLLETKWQ